MHICIHVVPVVEREVDMWATGVVCYELCTLNMPFHAASLLDIFVQVVCTKHNWETENYHVM